MTRPVDGAHWASARGIASSSATVLFTNRGLVTRRRADAEHARGRDDAGLGLLPALQLRSSRGRSRTPPQGCEEECEADESRARKSGAPATQCVSVYGTYPITVIGTTSTNARVPSAGWRTDASYRGILDLQTRSDVSDHP